MSTSTTPKPAPKPILGEEMTLEQKRARLRAEFPKAAYGLLPKPTKKDNPKGKCAECGGWHGLPAVHLDYIGHATVTDRLLEVDPEWTWEPCAMDETGLPRFLISQDGHPVGLWIRLTVLGVTRLGFGSVESNAFEPEKQLIGDALRNAAMRFGVALDLWSKAELESAALAHEAQKGAPKAAAEPARAAPPRTLDQAAERAAAPKAADKPPAAAAAPAASTAARMPTGVISPDGPDFNSLPEYNPDGSVLVFRSILVPKDIISLWGRWKNDKAVDSARAPRSKMTALKDRTWLVVTEGGVDGGRETTLRETIARTHADTLAGNPPTGNIERWVQKAAWALHTMYTVRAEEQAEKERNDDYERQTGIRIDPKGTSPVLFTEDEPDNSHQELRGAAEDVPF